MIRLPESLCGGFGRTVVSIPEHVGRGSGGAVATFVIDRRAFSGSAVVAVKTPVDSEVDNGGISSCRREREPSADFSIAACFLPPAWR